MAQSSLGDRQPLGHDDDEELLSLNFAQSQVSMHSFSYQSFRASAQPALSRQRTHAAHTYLSIAMPPLDPAASAEATHGSPNRTKRRQHNAPECA